MSRSDRDRTVLALALAGCSWLMLADVPLWWIGFGADMAALLLSWRILRRNKRSLLVAAALLAAAAAAAVCIAVLHTAPDFGY